MWIELKRALLDDEMLRCKSYAGVKARAITIDMTQSKL